MTVACSHADLDRHRMRIFLRSTHFLHGSVRPAIFVSFPARKMSTRSWDGDHQWGTALYVPQNHARLHVYALEIDPLPGGEARSPMIT